MTVSYAIDSHSHSMYVQSLYKLTMKIYAEFLLPTFVYAEGLR